MKMGRVVLKGLVWGGWCGRAWMAFQLFLFLFGGVCVCVCEFLGCAQGLLSGLTGICPRFGLVCQRTSSHTCRERHEAVVWKILLSQTQSILAIKVES